MKYTFIKSFVPAAALLVMVGSSCQKLQDFGDTNTNPLVSEAPITAAFLTNVESQLGGLATSTRPALYVQYISETQYTETSLYQEPKLDLGGTYSGMLNDLQVIINKNSSPTTAGGVLGSGSNANQIAVARILKAYTFWTVTDRFGDVPYSEALQGTANLSPAFDKQEDIYKNLLKELTEAVAQFDAGAPVKGDILYSGNGTQWKKLANSLRMMISMRMSKVFPSAGGLAATEFAAAATDPNGFIMTNADNATVNFPGGGYKNPWFNTYDGRNDFAFSKTIADILATMGDTRRQAFGGTGTPFPYGLLRADATGSGVPGPAAYSKVLSDSKRMENSPTVIVNAASSLLAHAEGIERGWTTGNAKASYDAAITASFDQWGVAGANTVITGAGNYTSGAGGGNNIGANAFNSVVGQNAITTTPIERIFLQRYLAHYPDGIQGWSEWRRSCDPGTPSPRTAPAGMPKLAPSAFAINSGAGIPRRYVYGTAEYSTNPVQVALAVGRLSSGDVVFSRVWWDK
ncbi:MAG: SusD/RagB family nutrient-binding outer membrane lipoprotein [Ferruginibacter sp.]